MALPGDPASSRSFATCIAVKWVSDPGLTHQGVRIYGFFKLVSKAYTLLKLSMKNPEL